MTRRSTDAAAIACRARNDKGRRTVVTSPIDVSRACVTPPTYHASLALRAYRTADGQAAPKPARNTLPATFRKRTVVCEGVLATPLAAAQPEVRARIGSRARFAVLPAAVGGYATQTIVAVRAG